MPLSCMLRAFAVSASSTFWARPPAPLGRCRCESGAGSLDHGVAFELGEGRHDRQHRLPHWASVCRPSVMLRKPTPQTSARRRRRVRLGYTPSGSSFQTVRASPSRRWSTIIEAGLGGGRTAYALIAKHPIYSELRVARRVAAPCSGPLSKLARIRCWPSLIPSHKPDNVAVLRIPVVRRVFKTAGDRLNACSRRQGEHAHIALKNPSFSRRRHG